MTVALRAVEAERTAACLKVGGLDLVADPSGALWWPEGRLLFVADLHLEKGSAFARSGQMLPPYDSRATLAALSAVVARLRPGTVVVMGDAFHDEGAEERMDATDAGTLAVLQAGRDWVWISGNHDPRPSRRFGGAFLPELRLGGVTLRHEPRPAAGPQIAGHLHPVGKVGLRGRAMRRR